MLRDRIADLLTQPEKRPVELRTEESAGIADAQPQKPLPLHRDAAGKEFPFDDAPDYFPNGLGTSNVPAKATNPSGTLVSR